MDNYEQLARDLVFGENKEEAYQEIRKLAEEKGIKPASIQDLYHQIGQEGHKGYTIPAINVRGFTFDVAKTIFQSMQELGSDKVIFEIAKSEMGYTIQDPREYAGVVLAAALHTGHQGPVYIQGDHFQVKAADYQQNPDETISKIKELIKEAINYGFYNIDVDTSTLVVLELPTVKEQQKDNYQVCAELTKYIREIQPEGVEVSVGGEIGEIGDKNSNPEELRAFMDGYKEALGEELTGISKMSVQTGTAHGGVPLPDGSVAEVNLDFDTLKELSEIAQKEYGLGGAVQHGASTLPDEVFNKFVECKTLEVHLATGFQNIILDSEHFPADLKEKMYNYIKTELIEDKKEDQTEEQFIYKNRKKVFGPHKQECWDMDEEIKRKVMLDLKEKFIFIFKQLNI